VRDDGDVTQGRDGARRPRATRADTVAAAVDIAAGRQFAAVTLSAVAEHMAVGRTALYHHFPGGLGELRSAVVEEIVRRLAGDEGAPVQDNPLLDWQQRTLAQVGRAAREYPGFLEYLLTAGKDEPYAVAATDTLLTVLRAGELAAVAPEAWAIMHAYITGWVSARRPSAETAERLGYAGLAEALRDVETLDPDALLFDGLQALLAGLGGLAASGLPSRRASSDTVS
jgi:AcrR family transcriptional regulator